MREATNLNLKKPKFLFDWSALQHLIDSEEYKDIENLSEGKSFIIPYNTISEASAICSHNNEAARQKFSVFCSFIRDYCSIFLDPDKIIIKCFNAFSTKTSLTYSDFLLNDLNFLNSVSYFAESSNLTKDNELNNEFLDVIEKERKSNREKILNFKETLLSGRKKWNEWKKRHNGSPLKEGIEDLVTYNLKEEDVLQDWINSFCSAYGISPPIIQSAPEFLQYCNPIGLLITGILHVQFHTVEKEVSHKKCPGIMDLFHLVYFPVIDYFVTDDIPLLKVSNDIIGLKFSPINTKSIKLSELFSIP